MTRSLADFIGAYSVSRRIQDHRTGQDSTFEGLAELTPTPVGATYTEKGTLTMGGQTFAAERSYTWQTEGAGIAVFFADGRPFHSFDPQKGGLATEHLCGADLYKGGYDFTEWSCWAVRWDVIGPRKDYASTTWYVRR